MGEGDTPPASPHHENNDEVMEEVSGEQDEEMIILDDEQVEELLGPYTGTGDGEDQEDEEMDEAMEDSRFIDPPRDDAIHVLEGHAESVFAVCMDPKGRYAVSGGQDDMAVVWDLSTGSQVFKCTGHKDSVISVAFSPDGSHLATGDMTGCIQVWRVPAQEEEVWQLNRSEPEAVNELQWLSWLPCPGAILAAGSGGQVGEVRMWVVGSKRAPKYFPPMGDTCVAGEFMPDGKRLAAVYESGQLIIWDIKEVKAERTVALGGKGEDEGVTPVCLACREAEDTLAVGAVGFVVLVRAGKQKTINKRIETGDRATVETIGFAHTHPFLAFATVNGTICVYDLEADRMRHKWTYCPDGSSGICKLVWSKHSPIFYAAGLDARITAWDARNMAEEGQPVFPLAEWFGHRKMLLDCCVGKKVDGEPVLVSCSDDGIVRVFSLAGVGSE